MRTTCFFSLMAAFVLATSFANAQITLSESDMAQIGDQITRYIDTIPAYGPGSAGAGQVWDFSNAIIEDTTITDVVTVASTPYASTFSSSGYAMSSQTNAYLYFTLDAINLYTDGAAGDLLQNGDIIETPFSDPLILHVFPRTFGSYFNDTYAFQATADGTPFGVYMIRLTHTGHVYDTTDAYGTLITPTGTYDALRVKTTDYQHDIVEAQLSQLFPVWTPVSDKLDTAISYSWHAKEEKLAIAEYSYDTIGNPKQFIYSTVPPVTATDIVGLDGRSGVTLYPQPANSVLHVNGLDLSLGPYRAEIYGIEGKFIKTVRLDGRSVRTDDLLPGAYLIRIMNGNGSFLSNRKFMVSH